MGRVSRGSPVQTAIRNCTRDEGRSFEAGSQVLASNRCKLLSSKAMVVSVAVNVGRISRRVRLREASASEPPMNCRKPIRRCQNRGVTLPPGSARGNPEDCPSGIRHVGGAKLNQALVRERENLCSDAKGEITSGSNREDQSTDAGRRGGAARSRNEGSVMELDRRGCVVQPKPWANRQREEPVDEAKPFNIPKRVVWKAFKRVKANRGAAGVHKQSIAGFEADLSNHLYKLWNRMCSGSYFPPPVRRVEIPKADGGMRPLGIATATSSRSCRSPARSGSGPGGRHSLASGAGRHLPCGGRGLHLRGARRARPLEGRRRHRSISTSPHRTTNSDFAMACGRHAGPPNPEGVARPGPLTAYTRAMPVIESHVDATSAEFRENRAHMDAPGGGPARPPRGGPRGRRGRGRAAPPRAGQAPGSRAHRAPARSRRRRSWRSAPSRRTASTTAPRPRRASSPASAACAAAR